MTETSFSENSFRVNGRTARPLKSNSAIRVGGRFQQAPRFAPEYHDGQTVANRMLFFDGGHDRPPSLRHEAAQALDFSTHTRCVGAASGGRPPGGGCEHEPPCSRMDATA